jgi:hypothetical protein
VGDVEPSRAVTIGYRLVTLLAVLAVGFGVLLIIDAATGIVRGGDRPIGGDDLAVHLELPMDRMQLPAAVEQSGWLPVTVRLHDPSAKQIALAAGLDLTQILLIVVGLWLLWGLARSVRRGAPFEPANVRRLRGLGFLLVLGVPAAELVNWALRLSLFNSLPESEFGDFGSPGLNVPGAALLAGLGVFILAEVFAHGLRLRDDVEGMV